MANLTNKQVKDGYPNLLTVGDTTQENPTTGEIQNGVGNAITQLNVSGNISATSLSGNGSQITNLNADNLASGTVPSARFPATLPAASGANLTALNATNIDSGTLASDRLPTVPTTKGGTGLTTIGNANQVLAVNADATALEYQTLSTQGSDLSNLNADNLTTGTVPNDRVAGLYTWMTQPLIQVSWNNIQVISKIA